MRLINNSTLAVKGPFFGADKPSYSILSHTWGDDELSYQEISSNPRKMYEHKRASRRSAELSEAINSMFAWYHRAAICFVFLEDLVSSKDLATQSQNLASCRWFTRGWTLQEFLAPKHIVFFDTQWREIGTKAQLGYELHRITGIDRNTLSGQPLERLSVARRMWWISRRKTTREEDIAYCLLGIFGINMPLLYGEGERTFLRLQKAVLQSLHDQSIFAWDTENAHTHCDMDKVSGYWSLLAPSPAFFENSARFVPVRNLQGLGGCDITARGVSIRGFVNDRDSRIALQFRPKREPLVLCTVPIARLRLGPIDYARKPGPIGHVTMSDSLAADKQIFVRTRIHEGEFQNRSQINYMYLRELPGLDSGYRITGCFSPSAFDPDTPLIRASPFPRRICGAVINFEDVVYNASPPFTVILYADGATTASGSGTRSGTRSSTSSNRSSSADRLSHDFAAVYQRPPIPIRDLWQNHLEPWFYGGCRGRLAGVTELRRVSRGGVFAWELAADTFVRVETERPDGGCADFIASANIRAGLWRNITTVRGVRSSGDVYL
ncbi:hypothetical protein B0T24DRAFT_714678 [Lasiosphaeria ovina]|uniref:Vegetative incompatibility protein HET-E-1 n=1 Tax=Lasiosphaeria ovina TaxID=92902 RepID=A0AAE0NJL7_9PEZI|nr:hypothetical protein B0T24DRAFT_714678 [Lasiosphaeria ovina]